MVVITVEPDGTLNPGEPNDCCVPMLVGNTEFVDSTCTSNATSFAVLQKFEDQVEGGSPELESKIRDKSEKERLDYKE